jgi:Ca2+-binding EF-hand superfamily protein
MESPLKKAAVNGPGGKPTPSAVLPPPAYPEPHGSLSDRFFQLADKNADNTLSRSEIVKCCKTEPLFAEFVDLPAHIGDSQRSLLEAFFQKADADGDKRISLEEFTAHFQQPPEGGADLSEAEMAHANQLWPWFKGIDGTNTTHVGDSVVGWDDVAAFRTMSLKRACTQPGFRKAYDFLACAFAQYNAFTGRPPRAAPDCSSEPLWKAETDPMKVALWFYKMTCGPPSTLHHFGVKAAFEDKYGVGSFTQMLSIVDEHVASIDFSTTPVATAYADAYPLPGTPP